MNTLKFLLITLSFSFLISCSGDNDIEGVWVIDSISLSSCPVDIPNTTVMAKNGCITIEGESHCLSFTLDADGLVESSVQFDGEPVEKESGTYTINGDTATFCFDNDCEDFELTNNTLVLNTNLEGCEGRYIFKKS